MNITWRESVWQQFGAAIDMLDNALPACPDHQWCDSVWDDPTDAPEKPYTKDQFQAYLAHCREKCQATFEALTDEKAGQRCEFPWGEEVSFAELQLYSMRHVEEHASQLSLHLVQKGVRAPDWVSRAENWLTTETRDPHADH